MIRLSWWQGAANITLHSLAYCRLAAAGCHGRVRPAYDASVWLAALPSHGVQLK